MEDQTKPTLAEQLSQSVTILSGDARASFTASHMILAMGSAALIFILVISNCPDAVPLWVRFVAAYAGGIIWYRAVEGPLRRFIIFAWAYKYASKDAAGQITDNLRRIGKASIFNTVIYLTATLALSVLVNPDIATSITKEKDSTTELAAAERVTTSYDKDVELLREAVEQARVDDARAREQAEEQAAKWVDAAWSSKGAEMRRLAKAGNGWAIGQLRRAVSRAKSKGSDYVASVQANATLPAAQAALSDYLATRSAGRDTVAMMATALVTGRRTDYLNTSARRNYMLLLVVLIAAAVFVWSGRALVLACLETGEQLDDEGGDGIVTTVAKLAGKANAKLGQVIADKFGDKLVLSPAVLSSPAPASAPTKMYDPPTKPEPKKPTPVPTKTPTKAKLSPELSPSLSAKLTVAIQATGKNLVVTIDGKDYTARQAADKARRWYERWKNADKTTTADKNRQRYQQAKAAMSSHFTFTERGDKVTVRQK